MKKIYNEFRNKKNTKDSAFDIQIELDQLTPCVNYNTNKLKMSILMKPKDY